MQRRDGEVAVHTKALCYLDLPVQSGLFSSSCSYSWDKSRKFNLKTFGFESKKKKWRHLEKRMMQGHILGWRSKERQGLVARKQVKGADGPGYHDSAITVSARETQQVVLKTTHSEKR